MFMVRERIIADGHEPNREQDILLAVLDEWLNRILPGRYKQKAPLEYRGFPLEHRELRLGFGRCVGHTILLCALVKTYPTKFVVVGNSQKDIQRLNLHNVLGLVSLFCANLEMSCGQNIEDRIFVVNGGFIAGKYAIELAVFNPAGIIYLGN